MGVTGLIGFVDRSLPQSFVASYVALVATENVAEKLYWFVCRCCCGKSFVVYIMETYCRIHIGLRRQAVGCLDCYLDWYMEVGLRFH